MRRLVVHGSRISRLAVISALTAGGLVAYLIALSPHLVHHLFEPADDLTYCPLAASGERIQAASADAVTPTVWATGTEACGLPGDQAAPSLVLQVPGVRAPPFPVS